jgi:thioredoxin-related protein
MKLLPALAATLLILPLAACDLQDKPPTHYDAAANPFTALKLAEQEARTSGKRILVIGGGDWCRWCIAMESFISQTPEVKAALDRNFVTVEVYYGRKNRNSAFFSTLPEAAGYPQFWVLSSDGKLIQPVDTSTLEDGIDSYDKSKFLNFIQEMGPHQSH